MNSVIVMLSSGGGRHFFIVPLLIPSQVSLSSTLAQYDASYTRIDDRETRDGTVDFPSIPSNIPTLFALYRRAEEGVRKGKGRKESWPLLSFSFLQRGFLTRVANVGREKGWRDERRGLCFRRSRRGESTESFWKR